MRILIRSLLGFLLLFVLLAGGLFYVASNGGFSGDQLRARAESQLSGILGPNIEARMNGANLALGSAGLLSLEVKGISLFREKAVNLGVADSVQLTIKSLPLLRGEVVANEMSIDRAKLSLLPFLPTFANNDTEYVFGMTGAIELEKLMSVTGKAVGDFADNMRSSGLTSIVVNEIQLIGFDQLGLRMREAVLRELSLTRDAVRPDAVLLSGELVSEHNTLSFVGSWVKEENGFRLELSMNGLDMKDVLVSQASSSSSYLKMDSPLSVRLTAPFDTDYTPGEADIDVEVGTGDFALGDAIKTRMSSARLSFSLLPYKNQIELNKSPIQFVSTKAVLQGGLRFARGSETRPLFDLLANDVEAYSMRHEQLGAKGALQISGSIDRDNRRIIAERMLLRTLSGEMRGNGSLDFSEEETRLQLDVAVDQMKVAHFKQFWPAVIATGAHEWADDGIHGGVVRDAKLSMRLPLQDLWDEKQLTSKQLVARIPIENTRVKTTGALPPISNAKGEVDVTGTVTSIHLSQGELDAGALGAARVDTGSLILNAGVNGTLPADLALKLSGKASAIAQLGRLEPLNFTDRLGLDPADLTGQVSAGITTSFDALQDFDPSKNQWAASIQIDGGGSKSNIADRKVTNANLVIEASSESAKVEGTALIDGVDAKLALVEPLVANKPRQSVVSLTLDERARQRLGIELGSILRGPVRVVLSSGGQGLQSVEADLTSAKLDLPWIGWSKGAKIAATAKFRMSQSGNVTKLENFSLGGKGFSAQGTLTLDKSGLVEADLSKVRLNKTDDFDMTAKRAQNGYEINVAARSYDGRAIIRTFLDNRNASAKNSHRVSVKGKIAKLIGFNGSVLSNVSLDYVQTGSQVRRALVNAQTDGDKITTFALEPAPNGMKTGIYSENAGAVLGFLDIYKKVRGGILEATLVRDQSRVFRGTVLAHDFTLLGEPRLAALLRPPTNSASLDRLRGEIQRLPTFRNNRAKVQRLRATIEKGPGFLKVANGQMQGGDASAAFEGTIYDRKNRIRIKGTFLPARGLNKLVSNIPLLGLAFGSGKTTGFLGITFRLSGPYGNPNITVNPLSVIAPGVFRQLFQF